jgi:catechol 2,3-dioxygenase-like lactoylglutathione lyase family enzyme
MPSVGNSRLVFVALRVREVEASARLYRDAFGVPFREGQPPEQHAEVSWSEGAYLHLALFPADEEPDLRIRPRPRTCARPRRARPSSTRRATSRGVAPPPIAISTEHSSR